MSKIIVVEDSAALNDLLCDALRAAGHDVFGFLDAESMLEHPSMKNTDVIVLDIQLPGESGLELAQRLRQSMPMLGILMLTTRNTTAQRIEGYDAGADYYLPKPVSPQELCDAVQSLLGRVQSRSQPVGLSEPDRYVLTPLTLRLTSGRQIVRLSDSDCQVLVALACAPDHQLEHWQLMDLLSTGEEVVTRGSLDVRMYRLRAKLAELMPARQAIVSVRGVGYRLGFDLEVR